MQTTIVYPLPPGLAGQLSDTIDHDVMSMTNQDALDMPFGVALAKGAGDLDCILPNGSGIIPVGVLLLSFVYDNGPNGELSSIGLRPKSMLNVLRKGRCYVVVEESVVAYDRAFIRYAAGGGGSQLGAFRKSADTGTALDVTKKIQYLTSASAGGIALIDVDMLNT